MSLRFVAALVALGLSALPVAAAGAAPVTWESWQHIAGVFDVAGPRGDGKLVVAGSGGLLLVDPATGAQLPFARGTQGYTGEPGAENYIALSPGLAVAGSGCAFATDDVYALALNPGGAVTRVDAGGQATRFAEVPGVGSLNGIAFDVAGRFGHRLLVTGPSGGGTVVAAIDCAGRVTIINASAPALEGGLAVAPAGFGAYAGDLIAPDELSGNLLAIAPDGTASMIAASGLPAGGDIGVEGLGFVPPGFSTGGKAYFADRSTPGNPHPGTDTLLRLDASMLAAAGVTDGDLVVSTEGGAATINVRCGSSCTVAHIADGPAAAHGEGHLLMLADRPPTSSGQLPEVADLGGAARLQVQVRALALVALAGIAVATGALFVLRRRRRGVDSVRNRG